MAFSKSIKTEQNKMKTKQKKPIASDVKSGLGNDTQTNGEIMAHFHKTILATVPLASNGDSRRAESPPPLKHAHNFKFSFN